MNQSEKELAQEAKARGNAFFAKQEWKSAINEFTEAIKLDPSNHIFFSNRSACHLSLDENDKALNDAVECIRLNPTWPKGYSRKGAVLYVTGDLEAAKKAYQNGLKLAPENTALLDGLKMTEFQLKKSSAEEGTGNSTGNSAGIGSMFANLHQQIAADPECSAYLQDPEFMAKLADIQADPQNNFLKYMNDPKIMKIMGLVIKGMGLNAPGMDFSGKSQNVNQNENSFKQSSQKTTKEDDIKHSFNENEQKAEELKNEGNEAYKNKQFEKAIELYTKAAELVPKNISYLTNRAAVHMMQKDFEAATKDCEEAVKIGRKEFSPFKQIAKALERLGDISRKTENYEKAIDFYKESLLESQVYTVKKKLRQVEDLIEERKRRNYIDPEKALVHKANGNEFFQQQEWIKAKEEYSESILRNPSDCKVYCNRAAVYSKLMAWEYALNDCDKAIKLDKTFAKSYLRKGKILHFLKDFMNAVITFNTGLDFEADSSQIKEAKQITMMEVMRLSREGKFDKEHQSKAMNDPIVQALMGDPKVRETLENMKTNTLAGQVALNDPQIMKKLEVLMAAGVVQMA